MALLTSGELDSLAAIVHSENKGIGEMTKDATRNVASDLNDFFDTNAAAINSAIRTPERTTAPTRFKQFIAGVVLLRQAGAIDANALRRLIREL